MKKLLTIALLGSLFAGQAFAKTATFKRAEYQIPKITKKALMNAKNTAEKEVTMHKIDMSKAQAMVTKYAKAGNQKELGKAQAKLRRYTSKYNRSIAQLVNKAAQLTKK